MLKRNYKKLVAVVSAAAMLATLAAPLAMAEDTEVAVAPAEEFAELTAAGVIGENNFDSLDEGTLMYYTGVAQDLYTELDAVNLHMGLSIISKNPDETTKASIKDGVGVDGSKALALSYGTRGDNGPRVVFDIPSIEDNFKITFDVYPTDSQDLSYANSTTASGIATGLVANEWNSVEIYVTRSGRIINANGVTIADNRDDSSTPDVDEKVMTAPVVFGLTKANTGDIYFDNVEITSLVSLPTPIPTPTPLPPYQPKIGDVFDFNDVAAGTLVFLNTTATPTYTALDGFELNVSSRGNGSAANTMIAIAAKGTDGSNALQLNYDNFADNNRGPRITLVRPLEKEYKITFKALSDGNQDLILATSPDANSGIELNVSSTNWSTVEIFMFGGQRLTLCDGRFVELTVTDNLPVLWGLNTNYTGSCYIDDYTISDIVPEAVTDAMANTLTITNSEDTVYLDSTGVYNFIERFPVESSTCGVPISWTVEESTDDGATWVETADLKAGKESISVSAETVSTEKLYKLTGTVKNGELTASKEFVLKYVAAADVVDTVINDIDIISDTYKDVISKVTTADGETYYEVRGNFVVPVSEWVASIDWSSSNESIIDAGSNGSILLYPREATKVTLTATVSYGGESQTKEFVLDTANQYQTVYRLVEAELAKVEISPQGTGGNKVTSITLDADGVTKVTYDLNLLTTSTEKGMAIKWKSSDEKILSSAGKINVDNMDSNEVTLTKKATYSIDGVEILSDEADYKINVEFDPETVKKEAVELAKAYALANDANATEAKVEDSSLYNVAMEMLYDRYVTRFDANYDENFADIPDEVDSDFDLPTEGAFGSEITWTSSLSNIKINSDGEADVTRPTNDKKAKLTATFTSGASVNADGKVIEVDVEGKGGSGSSGGSGGGGGSFGSASGYGGGNTYIGSIGSTLSTPAPTVSTPVADTTIKGEFTDLGEASWAEVAINYLANKGIVSGRTSTTFAPNDNITRAEFAKILVGAFELPLVYASAGFADVADDAWYAAYVNTCFASGIITGYDSTTFGPDDLVTRQDMAVMVMRAANLKGVVVAPINEKIDFADADEIGAYAVDAVTTLQMGGIINGMTADTFAPTANATRAQAAKILYSFCN